MTTEPIVQIQKVHSMMKVRPGTHVERRPLQVVQSGTSDRGLPCPDNVPPGVPKPAGFFPSDVDITPSDGPPGRVGMAVTPELLRGSCFVAKPLRFLNFSPKNQKMMGIGPTMTRAETASAVLPQP